MRATVAGLQRPSLSAECGFLKRRAARALVFRRVRHAEVVEFSGYGAAAQTAADPPGKYVAHCGRGLPVDDQGVFVLRVLGVAVRRKSPDELAFLPLGAERAAHVERGLVGILLVYEPGYRHLKPVRRLRVQERVYRRFIKRDEPRPAERDEFLEKLPLIGAVRNARERFFTITQFIRPRRRSCAMRRNPARSAPVVPLVPSSMYVSTTSYSPGAKRRGISSVSILSWFTTDSDTTPRPRATDVCICLSAI